MALGTSYEMEDCAIAQTLDVVGERWTLLIVSYLFLGLRRYSDIRKRLGISPAVLTQRLNRLVDEGIVARVSGAGAHDEYAITPKGERLWPIVSCLANFGNENYVDPQYRQEFTHFQCGDVLDEAGYCARCRVVPPAHDVVKQPKPAELVPAPAAPARGPRRLLH
ncbi:helix-turn-helix domain-containing protein [Humibacter soli]